MVETANYRKDILDALIPKFRVDKRFYLLICDMGFGAVDKILKEFPGRVINCGIMEQGTVGIAAGMSLSGLIPIVYCMVNFLAFRSIEQIRNDVVLQRLNVKFIATGANNYFKFLGPSHCCGTDDIRCMELIRMKVYDPYTSTTAFPELVKNWITSPKTGYFRV